MVGEESSSRQTMPLMIRQAPEGARTSKRKQLKKSSCRSTGDGVKAQERQGTMADPALPSREGDARGRAPRIGDHPLTRWLLPQGGEHRERTGRGNLAKSPARLRGPSSGLGMHALRPRGEHARGLEWCHRRKGGLLRAPHQLRGRGLGTGAGGPEGDRDPGAPTGGELHTDHRLQVQEGREAHSRW